jgi:hypothetical protein
MLFCHLFLSHLFIKCTIYIKSICFLKHCYMFQCLYIIFRESLILYAKITKLIKWKYFRCGVSSMSVIPKPQHSEGLGPLGLSSHEKNINVCNSDIKESVISVLGAGCTIHFSVTHTLRIVTLSSLKHLYTYMSAETYYR